MSGTHLRFINVLILVLFCILGLTGLYGLFWTFPASLFEIHRIAGWALIILIPGKSAIVLRSLSRGLSQRLDRNVMIAVSVLLAIATLTILILVLMWTWQIGSYYVWIGPFAYSAIGWHWGIALGLTPLFLLHVWRRWPRPKQADFLGRRQALKMIGLGAAAIASWGIAETLAKSMESTGAARRFTGSREDGSFTGLDFPITNGADQGKIKLDPKTWKLTLNGLIRNPLALHYADLLALSTAEVTATIDCTGGWYSTQVWRGVRLMDLIAQADVQTEQYILTLKDVSGYTVHFAPAEITEILLATHIGDQALNHWHGYPLRAVVPSRRGGHWVKWLTEIEITKL
jgi:hypothetical protein